MYDIIELNNHDLAELRDIAKRLSVSDVEKLGKQDLIFKILDRQALMPADQLNAIKKGTTPPPSAPAVVEAPAPAPAPEEAPAPVAEEPEQAA